MIDGHPGRTVSTASPHERKNPVARHSVTSSKPRIVVTRIKIGWLGQLLRSFSVRDGDSLHMGQQDFVGALNQWAENSRPHCRVDQSTARGVRRPDPRLRPAERGSPDASAHGECFR